MGIFRDKIEDLVKLTGKNGNKIQKCSGPPGQIFGTINWAAAFEKTAAV